MDMETMDRTIAQLPYVSSTIGIIVLTPLLLAFLLRYLWNTTMPDLFNFKKISYWQSFKLILIGLILFGGLFR